jgi:hypothetical protein
LTLREAHLSESLNDGGVFFFFSGGQEVIDLAAVAVEKFNSEKEVASYMKLALDTKHKAVWYVSFVFVVHRVTHVDLISRPSDHVDTRACQWRTMLICTGM